MNKPLVKKENLDILLSILPLLLEGKGNEWFKMEVAKLLATNGQASKPVSDTLHSFSEQGNQYLIINPNALLIDYDDIPDEKVRIQLRADCFEMARHRLGRVNHRPDFDEFCRYAHFQIEELINYYYQKKYGNDLGKIIKDIIENNSKSKGKIEFSTDLSRIGIINKIWAISNKLALGSNALGLLIKICYLRNDLSHRTSLTKDIDDQTLEDFQNGNGPIDSFQEYKLPEQIQKILFRKRQPWDDVFYVITKLKSKIIEAI